MQAPWLLVYVASRQREMNIRAAAEKQAEATRARRERRARRGCSE